MQPSCFWRFGERMEFPSAFYGIACGFTLSHVRRSFLCSTHEVYFGITAAFIQNAY
jgi:hypothetical protein